MAERITRTTKTTDVIVKCIDPNTDKFSEITFHLLGEIDSDKLFPRLQKNFTRPDRILLKVISKSVSEELREMSIDDWIKYSTPVEPKDRPVIEYSKKK